MIQEKQSFRASLDHFLADPSPLKQRCNQQAANHRRSFALPRPAMRSPGKGLFRSDARPGLQASRTSWRFWWVWEKGRNLETQQSATFRLAWWHAEAQIYETSIIKVKSLCWKKYLSKFSSKNLPIVLAVKCCSSCLPKAFHILQAHGHWVHERISSLMHRRQNGAVLLAKGAVGSASYAHHKGRRGSQKRNCFNCSRHWICTLNSQSKRYCLHRFTRWTSPKKNCSMAFLASHRLTKNISKASLSFTNFSLTPLITKKPTSGSKGIFCRKRPKYVGFAPVPTWVCVVFGCFWSPDSGFRFDDPRVGDADRKSDTKGVQGVENSIINLL